MLRVLLALPLLFSLAAVAVPADVRDADLATWAAPGEPIPDPRDPTALSLRFLEWHYLAAWVRADLAGEEPGKQPVHWAGVRCLRVGGEESPPWDLARRRRGACLYEELAPPAAELLAFCDSLTKACLSPVQILAEGILEAHLLAEFGLGACGNPEDPAGVLAQSLGDLPKADLQSLKEGAGFAGLYFDAEREVELWSRRRLAQVKEFLDQPGRLISLKYGFWKIRSLDTITEPEQTDEEHWLYPEGLTVDWDKGRSLQVRALPVLHAPKQNIFQMVEPDPDLTLYRGSEALAPQYGEFEIDGEYRVETAHVRIDINGGRYRREADELRLWWPNNFLEANRNGFFFAFLVLAVSVYLMVQNKRKKRDLAHPAERRRPRA